MSTSPHHDASAVPCWKTMARQAAPAFPALPRRSRTYAHAACPGTRTGRHRCVRHALVLHAVAHLFSAAIRVAGPACAGRAAVPARTVAGPFQQPLLQHVSVPGTELRTALLFHLHVPDEPRLGAVGAFLAGGPDRTVPLRYPHRLARLPGRHLAGLPGLCRAGRPCLPAAARGASATARALV